MKSLLLSTGLVCLMACPEAGAGELAPKPPEMSGDQFKTIRHVGMLQAACIFWRTQQISTKDARLFVKDVLDRTPAPSKDDSLGSRLEALEQLQRMQDLVVERRFGGYPPCKELF